MYIGQPIRRREDLRLVRGRGRFVDDVSAPDMAWVSFVRSPYPHARIRSIDKTPAERMPGIVRVLVAQDWEAAGLGKMASVHPMHFSDGRKMNEAMRPIMARDKVRHVGEVVAAVVGTSRYAAMDGAEAVEVGYEELACVTETSRALDPNAPILHEEFGVNLVNDIIRGDRAATDAAFARAAHITSLTLNSGRVAAMPLEPFAYAAFYDETSELTTLWATIQMPHNLRQWLCKQTLFIPEDKLRVIAPDVGGSFGAKGGFQPEVSIVVWMARELRRPVKWTSTRSEEFLTQTHARDHATKARMAFDAHGTILGLEVDTLAALGGYISPFGPSIPGNSYPHTIGGLYRTPALWLRVRSVYTNTLPTGPYRGSGRPEATWVVERLFENGAREMGLDVVEMRQRNLIQKHQFPYATAAGRVHDSGDPPLMLERLVTLASYAELRKKQQALRAQGIYMGIGLAGFFDKAGTGPSKNLKAKGGLHAGYEVAVVRVQSDGRVRAYVGTCAHGQGHETTYAALVADCMGLKIDDVDIIEGDTDRVPFGNGTWGGRSISVGGAALHRAATEVIAKARRIAAAELECDDADLLYLDQVFSSRQTNRSVSFADVANIAYLAWLPKGIEPGLECTVFHDPPDLNDPSALHLAVVIVDIETGTVTLSDYFTIDDAGVVINPLLVEGQIQGGLAQGIGQALSEQIVYDPQSGQLLTASFLDYGMPRADDMPALQSGFIVSPAPSNPLGVKGASESGTIGAPAAIGNAVIDALWDLGVRHIEMPMNSYTVWRALRDVKEITCRRPDAMRVAQPAS
jgi:carbon-monoxide dehydrogenase large subunit